MRCPHTHAQQGKRVLIFTRGGDKIIGKFQERKGRYVILDNHKVPTKDIRFMSIYKP